MPSHAEVIRTSLSGGPLSTRQLLAKMRLSQATIARALTALGDEVVRIGRAQSMRYALRDTVRGLPLMPVNQVDAEGRIRSLGMLVPVRPQGFVMRPTAGAVQHSEGLPWWLSDMRPQGYLGRTLAARWGSEQGLPYSLADWTNTQALHALLVHGHDVAGNLLLGQRALERFLATPVAAPIAEKQKPVAYACLAREVACGVLPNAAVGGEQPKFTTRAITATGACYVIVKFSEPTDSPVSERWRDLLLVEHLALETLRHAGIPAAKTHVIDHDGQRFLEVERFDRCGDLGRRALYSLATLDAEFGGIGVGGWPTVTQQLALDGLIRPEAVQSANLLWAFGTLIGDCDMHNGNLSFFAEQGRPYDLAPAYDMTAMSFAPPSADSLPNTIFAASLHPAVLKATWRRAEALAHDFLSRVKVSQSFSRRFAPCLVALEHHMAKASNQIKRL